MFAQRGLDHSTAGRNDDHAGRPRSRSMRWATVVLGVLGRASQDLLNNIYGVAKVAELGGDELGYLVAKVAEIKRQP